MTDAALAELQREILGDTTTLTHFGIRQSPGFVGETVRHQQLVHYVAPAAADVPTMLEGLCVFLERTQGQSAALRSAVAAFGFVYIHPQADGNGRVHRFLINDVLRRDGAIPEPVILPVSAVITDNVEERLGYDRVLDSVSRRLMHAMRESVRFEPMQTTYPDGVVSNLVFSGDDLATPLWRYPDLGSHVLFLAHTIGRTLTDQMREESRYLRSHGQARAALREIVEMPDHQADRVLRSIEQNRGKLSNALGNKMPVLRKPGLWADIVEAVSRAFEEDASAEGRVIEP